MECGSDVRRRLTKEQRELVLPRLMRRGLLEVRSGLRLSAATQGAFPRPTRQGELSLMATRMCCEVRWRRLASPHARHDAGPDGVTPQPLNDGVRRQMARMPRRDTKPELALRRELHRRGLRFRVKNNLPGRPDVVLTRARIAVFCDGCFWHVCPQHATWPKNNADWWREKLEANVARDRRQERELAALGWHVIRVWEHENEITAADAVELAWREGLRASAPAAGSHADLRP